MRNQLLRATRATLFAITVIAVIAVERPTAQIRESAERLAREAVAAQITSARRVKSPARITAGASIALAGVLVAAYQFQCAAVGSDVDAYTPPITASYSESREECVLDRRPSPLYPDVRVGHDPDYRIVSAGAGIAVLGALLATVWADVDATTSLIFDTGPNHVSLGKRISW